MLAEMGARAFYPPVNRNALPRRNGLSARVAVWHTMCCRLRNLSTDCARHPPLVPMPQCLNSRISQLTPHRGWRLAAAALVLLLATFFPAAAYAQSVSVAGTVIREGNREPGLDRLTIGYGDCIGYSSTERGEEIEVPLTLVGTQGYTLQVWSGLSEVCADNDARSEQQENGRCWPVYTGDPTNRVRLPVRRILAPEDPTETDGAAVCERPEEGSLTLYFLVFQGANSVGTGATLAFKYDLVGPNPPTLEGIEEGEGRLFARWDPLETSDIVGYRLYCEEAAGTAGAASACNAPTLRSGARPGDELRRGSASSTSDVAQASGLTNGVAYACGVAGYDKLENLGTLSNILCGTPRPVLDYFEAYRRAGGGAGGGFCRFGRSPESGGLLVGSVLLAFALRRRQRSNDAPRSGKPGDIGRHSRSPR